MKFEKYYEELKQLDVGTVLKDEPLYKHTTYRVGGPAKLFIKAYWKRFKFIVFR